MRSARLTRRTLLPCTLIALGALSACSESTNPPTEIPLGETTVVALVNPVVNTLNQATVPAPGTSRTGISVAFSGQSGTAADTSGIAVIQQVAAGNRTLTFSSASSNGQLATTIVDRDLRELAVALSGGSASVMADVRYPFGGTVVEVRSTTPLAEVNAALARSNVIVLFRSGVYTGNLVMSGSDVTLFGEGPRGGTVSLNGNIEVSGSRNRIRGTRISGTLTVPGSDFGMSFSRVAGTVQISGSNTQLLSNVFCASTTISGSGARVLGNAGLAPIPTPPGGC